MAPTVYACSAADFRALVEGEGEVVGDVRELALVVALSEVPVPFKRMAFREKPASVSLDD